MANQRWNADKNIQFINKYQRHECLWDPKHPKYKHREVREEAYKAIMDDMEMETVKDVISKIRTLRNTYNNETLKTKRTKAVAVATDQLYVPKIPWLHHLDFLKNGDSYTKEDSYDVIPNIIQKSSDSESEFQDFAVPPIPIRNKRKLKYPLPQGIDALENVATQYRTNASTNDEFDFFGQTIAEQLRQLPLETALETEEMLLSTIVKQRIKVVKSKQALSQ